MEIRYRRDLHKIIDLSLPAAEIGVAEGYFSADILSWGVHKLYMVDNWGTLPVKGDGGNPQSWHERNYIEALERTSKYNRKVLRGISWEMAGMVEDNSLGFINIDCDHSYEGVTNDINAWWPKLVKGGVMAFHDYENNAYGVKTAVTEFCRANSIEINLLPEDKIADAGCYIIKTLKL
jgi:hypothetical protein